MPKLSDWKWCVDYSNSVGQKDAKIAPLFFKSREAARSHNYEYVMKGRVVAVVIKEIKRK